MHELVFAPRDATTEALIEYYVKQALGRWEPRINVDQVNVDYSNAFDGNIIVEIKYSIKNTHDQRSIVYPFFISEE